MFQREIRTSGWIRMIGLAYAALDSWYAESTTRWLPVSSIAEVATPCANLVGPYHKTHSDRVGGSSSVQACVTYAEPLADRIVRPTLRSKPSHRQVA